jgi:small redox-active disulfide protein 2
MIKIQIYGTGCPKCIQLAQHAEAAAQALGLEYEVEKVTDINAIIDAGILSTPGLGVNGEVKSTGRVLSSEAIKGLLQP